MTYENNVMEIDPENVQLPGENGYRHYEKYYFAFIDVLGFKKNFMENKKAMCKETPNPYDIVFEYYFKLMNKSLISKNGDADSFYAGQTSDSLYFYTNNPQYLLDYIKIFQHFNNYAMSKDVFFRGGIAKGFLHTNEKYQFYGDSVIKAYLLESVVAVKPIVLIDEEIFSDLKNRYGDEMVEELIETHADRHYIKLFDVAFDIDLLFDERMALENINMKDVEANILKNKKEFEFDPSNFNKYSFLQECYKIYNANKSSGGEKNV